MIQAEEWGYVRQRWVVGICSPAAAGGPRVGRKGEGERRV